MTTHLIRNLGILLALQIIVIAAFWFSVDGDRTNGGGKLLTFDPAAIDRVSIGNGEQQVMIARQNGQWLLPEHQSLPLRPSRMQSLLDKLAALDAGWPVATSASAAERFEVATDNAQRAITLFTGEQQASKLWLGTSPGMGKVHARRDGDDAVYAIELALHELPDKPDSWVDKSLLAVTDPIQSVRAGDFELQRHDDSWQLADAASTALDQDAVQRWVDRFASLSVGNALSPDTETGEPLAVFALETGTQPVTLSLYKVGEAHAIRSSRHDVLFELPDWQAEPLLTADRAGFEQQQTDDADGETDDT